MNAAIKYVAIPVIAVAAIAVTTAPAADFAALGERTTKNATSLNGKETLAGQLAIALRDNDNVAGTIGVGSAKKVAVWFKAEPSAAEIGTVCTKAGELGLTEVHKMVVGVNNLEPVTCP